MSIFITSVIGIEYLSTKLINSWWNINSASFWEHSGISSWTEVQVLLTKAILTKRLFVQDKLSRSTTLRYLPNFSWLTLWLLRQLHFLLNAKPLKTFPLFCPESQAVMVYLLLTKCALFIGDDNGTYRCNGIFQA